MRVFHLNGGVCLGLFVLVHGSDKPVRGGYGGASTSPKRPKKLVNPPKSGLFQLSKVEKCNPAKV